MIKKIDNFLTKYENKNNINVNNNWYDFGNEEAIDILKSFSQNDWNDLKNIIPKKSDNWKERLAYSLSFIKNENTLNIMLSMIDTDDIYLFEIIIFYLTQYEGDISNYLSIILRKIDQFLPIADSVTKDIFVTYINKLHDKYNVNSYNIENINENYYKENQILDNQDDIKKHM